MLKIKLSILLIAVIVLSYFCFNPIIFNNEDRQDYASQYSIKEGKVKILKDLDFTKNEYKALLIIRDKIDLSDKIKGTVLETEDITILKSIQKEWKFTKTNGDLATVENELLIYENETILFRTGIVLDQKKNSNLQGLQNSDMGWLRSNTDLIEQCSRFERVYFPLCFL